MRFFKNKDAASGIFLVVFSIWAFCSTSAFGKSSISTYGNPAVVPRIVTVVIFVLINSYGWCERGETAGNWRGNLGAGQFVLKRTAAGTYDISSSGNLCSNHKGYWICDYHCGVSVPADVYTFLF